MNKEIGRFHDRYFRLFFKYFLSVFGRSIPKFVLNVKPPFRIFFLQRAAILGEKAQQKVGQDDC